MAGVRPRSEPDGLGAEGAVIGRYRVTGSIGQGAMGVVLRGHDPVLDREVAIKMSRDLDGTDEQLEGMLHEAHTFARIDRVTARDSRLGREVAANRPLSTTPSGDAAARFLREARIQARLDHPSIVPVYELGTDADGTPYFTMKRLVGVTLEKRLSHPATDTRTLLNAFVAVCAAIDLAHARGVVHRDLKPENIVLGDYREVYVLDWGVARVLDELDTTAATAPDDDAMRTQTGTLIGTPRYMAPEQARGEAVGPPADVFALGAILFEILAGKPLRARDLTVAGTSPAQARPDRAIAPELDAACCAALADAASDRPSVHELGERVQRYLDGDRDHERRRALSAELLAQAAATAPRAEQMQLAGRALALDPESREAAALVTRLVLEPPAEIPPEVARSLEAREVEYTARSSRMAFGMIVVTFLVGVLFLLWTGVIDVPVVVELSLLIALLLVVTWVQTRSAIAGCRVNVYPSLICTMMVTATASRFSSSFLFVPLVVTSVTATVITQPQMLRRPVVTIAICMMGFVAPVVLEALGVLKTTWHVDQDQVVLRSTVIHFGGVASEVFLIASSVFCIVVAGVSSWGLAKARRDAVHQLELQSWRLMQLVPKSVRP
jgi:serine/threonine-protein kinase